MSARETPGNAPILVAVDGSPSSQQAAAWAAVTAALHNAPLHVFTAIDDCAGPARILSAADRERRRGEGEGVVAAAARIASEAVAAEQKTGPDITTEVCADLVIPTLLERSATVRMIVLGSRGTGAYLPGLLGSVTTAVVRHATCPVAVIPDRPVHDEPLRRAPVVVGVDGSRHSAAAVDFAVAEAARRGVDLVAVHSWCDTSTVCLPADWEAIRTAEEAVLAERMAGYGQDYPEVTIRRIVVSDRPVRALHQAAAQAQMLVVGSRGRGGFTGMQLGSTSNALLHMVECPMVVVR
ncbi:universal stress protein [Nocardia higoensis]|uniref:Universal stress protein n=1 Tax=Nocardia higoensis TaxID=228599 RepID=A0ABS0D652_9NOCA|nr:universal stress protein [Nocardia higoensis]MBF6353952.1 universal stress protein [Nocardia higoensis]